MIKVVAPKKSETDSDSYASFKAFFVEFAKESDRACVILGAAKIDILLKQLLLGLFLPSTSSTDELLDGDSALGTFSAKIQLAYRLGLLDAEFTRALNLIRKIRNEFAHEASTVSLSHPSHRDRIRHLVSSLKSTKAFNAFKDLSMLNHTEGSARDFRAALALICARLENAVDRVSRIDESRCTAFIPKAWLKKADASESPLI